MEWNLDKNRPLCPQICEQVCVRIALGEFGSGQRLPSVRELALVAGVNPNTVQRAFEHLEQQGILYSVRGSGWYAAEDTTLARDTLDFMRAQKTTAYFEQMAALGMSPQDIKTFVKEWENHE